jgi:arginine exporter protein ArgO
MEMGDVGTVFVAGLLAGGALAVPLGAIGLLLVREGLTGGMRAGAAGATAVATVDGLYCAAALLLGAAWEPLVSSWGPVPGVMAGAVLIIMGGYGLAGLARPAAVREGRERHPSPGRVFALFLGLTAVNPATLVYFVALTAALPASVAVHRAPAVFVAGVVLASLAWQLALVAAGAFGGGRIGGRGRAVVSGCGFAVVALLGAAAVVTALV